MTDRVESLAMQYGMATLCSATSGCEEGDAPAHSAGVPSPTPVPDGVCGDLLPDWDFQGESQGDEEHITMSQWSEAGAFCSGDFSAGVN